MADIVVQPQTVQDFHVHGVTAGSPPRLRIFCSNAFFSNDTNPIYVPEGGPNGGQYYLDIACTYDGVSVVTVPTFTVKSTTDAVALTVTSYYTFYWYRSNGQYIGPVDGMERILVPPEIASASACTPIGTCATWADLENYSMVLIPNIDLSTYTKEQIDNKIAAVDTSGTLNYITKFGTDPSITESSLVDNGSYLRHYDSGATRYIDFETGPNSVALNGSGSTLNIYQQIAPINAPTVALAGAGAGNIDNGLHSWKVTYVTASGETDGGTTSSQINVTDKTVNGQVTVTIPSGPSTVTTRKVYRTVAGDTGNYKLVGSSSGFATASFTDNVADSGLGAGIPTTNTGRMLGYEMQSGSILIPCNASYRQYDNAGNATSILSITTSNNLQVAAPAASGNINIVIPNATGSFNISNTASFTLRFTVLPSGFVGIGRATPTSMLHLDGEGQSTASVGTATGTNAANYLRSGTAGLTGGNTTIATTGTGGNGGGISLNTADGGQATAAATSSTGGIGGGFTVQMGTGGAGAVAGSGTNTGGAGGACNITGGTGGAASGATSNTNTGGNGGAINLTAGPGGVASNGGGSSVSGNGGALNFIAGTAGAGTAPGTGGAALLRGGVGAAVATSAGGQSNVTGGAGSSTGSGGAGGAVALTGGASNGDGTVVRAGGNATVQGGNSGCTGAGGTGGNISINGGTSSGNHTAAQIGGSITLTARPSFGNQSGGTISFITGAGGQNPTSSGSVTGPNGGGISWTFGAGGIPTAATATGIGGVGGTTSMTAGTGGVPALGGSVNNTGGAGGALSFTGGTGGAPSTSTSGTNTGGAGGAINITGGAGAVGTSGGVNAGGNGGNVIIRGGVAGAGGTNGIVDLRSSDAATQLQIPATAGTVDIINKLKLNNNATAVDATNTAPTIYGTSSGGAAYPFLEAGNLIIQSRPSGATRDILFYTGSAALALVIDRGAHQILTETSTDPTAANLTSGSNVEDRLGFYMKNDKLVFAVNRSGTVNYLTIPLDGATTAWSWSTTAP